TKIRFNYKHIIKGLFVAITSVFIYTTSALAGETYVMPAPGNDIIGGLQTHIVQPGDTMGQIARDYEIGLPALLRANPNINPNWMFVGVKVIIPTAYILTNVKRKGIVINLSELRLYYFFPQENIVMTAPVAIGRDGWETPLATTKIIE